MSLPMRSRAKRSSTNCQSFNVKLLASIVAKAAAELRSFCKAEIIFLQIGEFSPRKSSEVSPDAVPRTFECSHRETSSIFSGKFVLSSAKILFSALVCLNSAMRLRQARRRDLAPARLSKVKLRSPR